MNPGNFHASRVCKHKKLFRDSCVHKMLQGGKVESHGLKDHIDQPIKDQTISIPIDRPAIVPQVRVHASPYRGGRG